MSQTNLEEQRQNQWRPAKSEPLRVSYWRSEILQLMFWLKDEGFGDHVDAALLERFSGVDSHVGVEHLDRLVDEGYIERADDRYRLSTAGARQAQLEFAASFADLMKPAHGGCSPSSWCHHRPDDGSA